ncbi:MAG: hypothetical protein EXR99_10935 [Gemmataceae bacterium]|nr:hypothetical protein [Gemmataceae bacterium]
MVRNIFRGIMVAAMFSAVVVYPILQHRNVWNNGRRLRMVEAGKMYRSGQLTVEGFKSAIARHNLRTIVNLQEDLPDPDVPISFWNRDTVKEKKMCQELGIRYLVVGPDLIPRHLVPEQRPKAIDEFLRVCDDPANYPMLIHCRAGLHRTGVLAAVYRMEYQGWSRDEAFREMKDHGFGDLACNNTNDYVIQYVLTFKAGLRPRAEKPADAAKVASGGED